MSDGSIKDLSGYKKRDPSLPPADFPQAGKELRVDRGKLKDVASALQKDMDDLNTHGPGTYNDLTNGDLGLVTSDELGNYTAAQGLTTTVNNAYNVIGNTYQQFLTSYQALIDTISQTGNNYNAAEDANTQAANAVKPNPTSYNA
jgi:hypothetical protein